MHNETSLLFYLQTQSINAKLIIPFQVYQKHNRNLIGDDDLPEFEMALRRRLSSVSGTMQPGSRFPQTVSSVFNSPLSSPDSPLSPKSTAGANPTSSFDSGTYFPFSGLKII
jgi:hypothetical protein